jgi:hypothetical protein
LCPSALSCNTLTFSAALSNRDTTMIRVGHHNLPNMVKDITTAHPWEVSYGALANSSASQSLMVPMTSPTDLKYTGYYFAELLI